MSTINPTLLEEKTRIRPANVTSRHRSPTRSPVRKAQFQAEEIDPLLGNLSPSSTLEALSLTEALNTNRPRDADILAESIAKASTTERAHGIKAAVAAQKLREWHEEILGWKWPAKKERRLGKGFQPRDGTFSPNSKQKQYLGSLPMTVVAQHEERIEEIKDGLEALDVEGLKEHVLKAHLPTTSKKEKANASRMDVVQLSDFTAVITHTMLQALPYLSKLITLLNDWDIRIVVLKQVPQLLCQLEKTETAIDHAQQVVCASRASGLSTRPRFEETKAALDKNVSLLGATFDKLLDLLEGREDSLPGRWIDRMDKVETSFAQWTVEAEGRVLYNEWMEQNQVPMPERREDAEALNATGHGLQDEFCRTTAQMHSVTTPRDDTKDGVAVRLRNSPSHSEERISTPPRSGTDDESPSSAMGLTMSSATPPSLPSAAMVPVADKNARQEAPAQSVLDSATTPHLPTVSPRYPVAEEAPSVMNVDAGSEGHGQLESMASDDVLELIDQLPQSQHSAVSSLEHAPVEPKSEPLDERYHQPPDHEISALINGPRVLQKLTLDLSKSTHRRRVSEVSVAQSTVSEAFSDLSNAEVVKATTAEALGSPKLVSHSVRASRGDLSNLVIEPKAGVQSNDPPRQQIAQRDSADRSYEKAANMFFGSLESPISMPVKAADFVDVGDDDSESSESTAHQSKPLRARSHRSVISQASISSVEKIAKDRIRSIIVRRRDSSSSSLVSPISPLDTSEPFPRATSAMSVSPLESTRSSTSLSKNSSGKEYFSINEEKEEALLNPNGGDSQPPLGKDEHTSVPGIPRRSSKRVSREPSGSFVPTLSSAAQEFSVPSNPFHEPPHLESSPQTWSAALAPEKHNDGSAVRTPAKTKTKPQQEPDSFESKIQSLLSRIPARIRLLSDSDPDPDSPAKMSSPSSRSPSPIPSIILSPVKPQRRPQPINSNTPNSDVRLFHLSRSTEPQSTPPVKLFVRLVGEHGERIMVRVGGGWADLGDYLRDYSLHHSKRGLNNGQFELATLPVSGQKDSKDSRVIPIGPELMSRATTGGPLFSKTKSPASSRPGSAMDYQPSAVSPFGVSKPTRRRRSTSATGMHLSGVEIHRQSPPTLGFPFNSHINPTDWEPPPVPPLPELRTLNQHLGHDPRKSTPLRHQPSSSNSPKTPTPSTSSHARPKSTSTPSTSSSSHHHQHHPRHHPHIHTPSPIAPPSTPRIRTRATPPPATTTTGTPSSAAAAAAATTTPRNHPTIPAAARITVVEAGKPDLVIDADDWMQAGAPAPNIGSSPQKDFGGGGMVMGGVGGGGGGGLMLRKRGSVGDVVVGRGEGGGMGGGIRRVFFRRKVKVGGGEGGVS